MQEGIQFAGTKNGGEKVLHIMRSGLEANRTHDYQGMDQSLAFNNINLSATITQLIKVDPETAAYAKLNITGKNATTIYHGMDSGVEQITQEEGLSPGSGKSMTYFNIGSFPIIKRMSDECMESGGVVAAYADDWRVIGTHETQIRCIQIMNNEGKKIGLQSNVKKNIILMGISNTMEEDNAKRHTYIANGILNENIRTNPDTLHPDGTKHGDIHGLYGHIVNGVPVGTEEFVERELQEELKRIESIFNDYKNLDDSQIRLHLMRSVVDKKIVHLLRQLDPKHGANLAYKYNILQQQSLTQMLRLHEITELEMQWARLDTVDGGLGLLDANGLVDAAYVASFITCLPSVIAAYPGIVGEIEKKKLDNSYNSLSSQINQLFECVNRLASVSPHITIEYLQGLSVMAKKQLQHKLHKNIKNIHTKKVLTAIQNSGKIPHAILLSSSGYQASAWLHAQPTGIMKMANDVFENSIRNRLAMEHPYINIDTMNPFDNKMIDKRGISAQKTKFCHSQTIITHNTMTQACMSLAKAAQCTATNQCTNLLDDGKELDILVLDGVQQDTGLDIRITNAIDAAIENGERKHDPIRGEMAAKNEHQKNIKFQARCKKKDIDFIPIVFEVNGQWGNGATMWVKKMISKQSRACNVPSSSLTTYWTQLIAVALQKKVSQAQIITMNKINAIRNLNKYENCNSYLYDNHQDWERQGSIHAT
jgi:hypothetical protein